MIEMQLKRIHTLIRRLSAEDGTLKGVDKRLEISLLLSYFLEYSDADIARFLNVSAPTVARRKKAALSELKQLIGSTYHAG